MVAEGVRRKYLFVIATGSAGKIRDFAHILGTDHYEFQTLKDIGADKSGTDGEGSSTSAKGADDTKSSSSKSSSSTDETEEEDEYGTDEYGYGTDEYSEEYS